MILTSLALALAPALPALPQEQDRIVRLRNGRILVGVIEDHDLDGFRFVAARHGGRFELDWSDLFPGEADRLRDGFGYRSESAMPTTNAHRILMKNGEERVGRILNEDNTRIELRTLETTVVLPKSQLAAPPEPVTVPVPQVLTPEQYYTERAPEVPADDRLEQYEFARELESVFALERAGEHYAISQGLAEEANDDALLSRLEGAQQQLERMLANREEAQALKDIRQLMNRERFAEAEELLESWDDAFPDSKLRGELNKLADDFEDDRDAAITRYLRRNWHSQIISLMKKRSLDREVTMDQNMAWLEGEVPQMVREQMLDELKGMDENLTLQELDRLWQARMEGSPPRHQAGYGDGTWILGTEKARAGLQAQEEEENDGKTPEQREMEERMQKYLRNLESSRRAGSASQDDVTPEDWWRKARTTQRFQFLMAYYAEFSGDFQIANVSFSNCSTCAGAGVIETVNIGEAGAKATKQKCPTCHQVAVRRSVTYR